MSILLGKGDGSFQPAVNYTAGVRPNSLVVGDLNLDGKLDLAVVNYTTVGTVNILFGNGDGTFQAAVNHGVGSYPSSIISRDFNADGKRDLALTDYNGVMVLFSNGNGTFQNSGDYAADHFQRLLPQVTLMATECRIWQSSTVAAPP